MESLIFWILGGALVGWLASIVMGTDARQGALSNIVIGIVGAILGGWIFGLFGGEGVTGFNLYSLLVAFVGAAILIAIIKQFRSTA